MSDKLRCSSCSNYLHKSDFHKKSNKKRGYDYICKQCRKARNAIRIFEPTMEGCQKCTKCEETKSVLDFFACRRKKNGRASHCKNCENKRKLKRLKNSPKLRITENLRRRMRSMVKHKCGKSLDLIGCTSEELKKHLESQFIDGMSWDNYGNNGWHIDHIIPCSSFDLMNPDEQRKCFHYSNLQPLWAKDNLVKGNNFKSALITGVTGQLGSYLLELLLSKNYKVVGISRRTSTNSMERIRHLLNNPNFKYQEGDVTDSHSINNLISQGFDEVYHLAAQSHVQTSFDQPMLTSHINYIGTLNILNAIKIFSKTTKMYFAATSEMFGKSYSEKIVDSTKIKYQDENTPFIPQSPYAISKLAAFHAVRLYRDSYDLNVCSGIMFNNESPRRGELFVTKKITNWIRDFDIWRKTSDIQKASLEINDEYIVAKSLDTSEVVDQFPKLRLGNLDAYRDWGHSKDTAKAAYLMLQEEKLDDYVICTGETHSIREFLLEAFSFIDIKDWSSYVVIDPKFFRPAEVDYLNGSCDKAKKALNWKSEYSFRELVRDMMNET